jgi:hypothetical protein
MTHKSTIPLAPPLPHPSLLIFSHMVSGIQKVRNLSHSAPDTMPLTENNGTQMILPSGKNEILRLKVLKRLILTSRIIGHSHRSAKTKALEQAGKLPTVT